MTVDGRGKGMRNIISGAEMAGRRILRAKTGRFFQRRHVFASVVAFERGNETISSFFSFGSGSVVKMAKVQLDWYAPPHFAPPHTSFAQLHPGRARRTFSPSRAGPLSHIPSARSPQAVGAPDRGLPRGGAKRSTEGVASNRTNAAFRGR
jgi:hypothetical protein